ALGIWKVKPGREEDFRQAWTEFAQATAQDQPGMGFAYLLQDSADPQRFISFGPWKDAEAVASWRASDRFQAFFAEVRELCEDVQPNLLHQRAYVPAPAG
ncbi:MAG TPA: antibiotic biosynthesis monooxygenase family protein, partial [Dehalococcoidia bacterium]|nr:antibiotic biosynthesis monooxygenase family protein [Dehalococcoidia bacterium]